MYNKASYDKKRYKTLKRQQIANKPPDCISLLKPTERAYIAGIIDGEGTIYARNERKTIYPTLAVHMTDKAVILWLQDQCKGQRVWTINRKETTLSGNPFKTQYLFRICGKRAKLLCKVLLPYLITKKAHAEIVIRWPIDVRGTGLSPEIQRLRKQLGKKLTNLNGNRYKLRHK